MSKLLQILGFAPTEEEKRERRNAQSLRLIEQEKAHEPTSFEKSKNYFLDLIIWSDLISERKSSRGYKKNRIRDNMISNFQQLHFIPSQEGGNLPENKD